ncbi:cytochrome P450 [Luminiphilus sp. nBUS_16]|uniref:cytochrome P450 n=1 Tax=unclassified Luminiphilus TaxID=2633198 RepID=UPI003EBB954D
MSHSKPFVPPHPQPLPALPALARVLWHGDGNLLELLPGAAYRFDFGNLGYSRRSTVLFNQPGLVREILRDDGSRFPKSDLMVNALEPLIGQSIFVTDGARWKRQRGMIDPAFSQLRVSHAFEAMQSAVHDHLEILDGHAESGESFSLDMAMSHLTADVICRTIFSTPLATGVSSDVFEDFTEFEQSVAQVDIFRLIFQKAWAKVPQLPRVLAACQRIRGHLGDLLDPHLQNPAAFNDIASEVIAAKDSVTGAAFTREELIDQLGVFFLAGHETSASALTWVFYVLAEQPTLVARLRTELDNVVGAGAIDFSHVKQLPLVRAVFKETLRLYPPITFIPRVALENCHVGPRKLRRGALVMVSPWTLHRHQEYWENPNAFIPDRFLAEGEGSIQEGAYIPFGVGPHTCIGAGFAQAEAILIIAELVRRFDFRRADTRPVRPAARLTTRPAEQIRLHCRRL